MDENNLLQQCWICMDQLNDYILLPEEDEYFGEDIGIFKNTFIIKKFYTSTMERLPIYSFLYFTCCNNCIFCFSSSQLARWVFLGINTFTISLSLIH